MNAHLTWEEMSGVLMGERGHCADHSRDCARCRTELDRFESALGEFRGSMRQWSGQVHRQREFVRKPDGVYASNVWKAGLSSLLINSTMIAMILIAGTLKPVQLAMQQAVTLIAPKLEPFKPENKGGGGGGARQPLEQTKAQLPKAAPRQFTPPRVDPVESRLQIEPTIIADAPLLTATSVGDIKGLNIPSNGTGFGGGIGSGGPGGVGGGKGSGAGVGSGGGFGGAVYRPGANGVTGPQLIHKVEPQYSEAARKAKWQGTVSLSLIVDANGKPVSITVTKPLGLDLDQKAVEAVEQWLFKPGMKDGKPVPVYANVDVSFRLL